MLLFGAMILFPVLAGALLPLCRFRRPGARSAAVMTAESMTRGPSSGVRKRLLQPYSPSPAAMAAFQTFSGIP